MTFRVIATCRKHPTHYNVFASMLKAAGWTIKPDKELCKFYADFKSMPEAKECKAKLQWEISRLERSIKPMAGYNVIFTNAYWIPSEGMQ